MSESELYRTIEKRITGLYNILCEEDITGEEIELYELTEDAVEGEIQFPYIGINFDQWEEWSTEKRIEVLLHEFAHTTNYEDDHEPDFWTRVSELTEAAIDHQVEIEELFGSEIDPQKLKRTVTGSVHAGVIEQDVDSVANRKRAVGAALGVSDIEG